MMIKNNSNTDLTNLYLSVDRMYLLLCDSMNNHQLFKITTQDKFKKLISADMEGFIDGISHQSKQLSAFFLPIVHYKEDLLKMVITFPLISSVVTGPKRRLSFAPERISDIRKYSPSFSLTGYFTASVS